MHRLHCKCSLDFILLCVLCRCGQNLMAGCCQALHSSFFRGYIDEDIEQYCARMRYLGYISCVRACVCVFRQSNLDVSGSVIFDVRSYFGLAIIRDLKKQNSTK